VDSIKRDGGAWLVNDERFDAVLSTIPPQELARVGGLDVPQIPYQGAACVTLGLDQDATAGIYWLNMRDPAPYGAVISHTNFVPKDRYGEHIVYLGSYFSGEHPPDKISFLVSDFCRRFRIEPSAVHWQRAEVERYAGPVYTTGYQRIIPDYEHHGLYMAGMFSKPNYPERSMEGSVIAAQDAVQRIERGMVHG
jgi:protoporphyrinogen oxidase